MSDLRMTVELEITIEDSALLREVAARTLSEVDHEQTSFGRMTLRDVAYGSVRVEDVQQSDEAAFGVVLAADLMLSRRLFPGSHLRSAKVDWAG
ncbi:hypothetical protein [Modestobacter sp. SSW1-42]|uniref:hypothetical protein n=1 Tax=Modestobacter sp. SSW1-42 TaxID=596372 RepID=UPI003987E43D